MPALVAHHHFAVHALKLTPPHVQAAVSSAPAAFRWGAQGPDILYFHNPPLPGKLPRLGGTMHRYKILRCFQTLSAWRPEERRPILSVSGRLSMPLYPGPHRPPLCHGHDRAAPDRAV